MDKDRLRTRKLLKVRIKRRLQHHIYLTVDMEPCFQKQPPQLWLSFLPQIQIIWKNGKCENLRCEKTWLYRKKSWQTNSYGGKMSSENAILYFAWVSRQQGHLLFLLSVCFQLLLKFINSKYFKTAVKSTVTISSKILSDKKIFFKSSLQSPSVCSYVYIYIVKK